MTRSMPSRSRLAGLCAAPLLAVACGPAAAQTGASPYGFAVQVSLSPKALDRLTRAGEGVTVRSFYYGKAAKPPSRAEKQRAEAEGREPGAVEMTGEDVTLPAAGGVALLTGRGVSPAEVATLGQNPLNVNVNVFSARRTAPDNLLACDLFDDAVAVARAKPVAITCRLIGER